MAEAPYVLGDAVRALLRRNMPEVQSASLATRIEDVIAMLGAASDVMTESAMANDPEEALRRAVRGHIAYTDVVAAMTPIANEVGALLSHAKWLANESKEAARNGMISERVKTLPLPAHVASLVKPKVERVMEVHEPDKVPRKFYKVALVRDDELIDATLRTGEAVPGARLVDKPMTLRINPRK